MKLAIEKLSKSSFLRDVMIVASGTAAAQAIGLLVTPIVTRLYGPEAIGLLTIFGSVVGLMSTVAALGYSTAIVLPASDVEARRLVTLAISLGLIIAVVSYFPLFFFGEEFLQLLNAQGISGFLALIPLAFFLLTIAEVLNQWLIREKAYKVIAKYKVITALIMSSGKIILGFTLPTAANLIVTNMVVGFLGSLLTFLGWARIKKRVLTKDASDLRARTMLRLVWDYRDFPLLRMPQHMVNAFSQTLPILLLSGYSGASSAGQYSISLAVLGVPAALIGGSVMSVFYPKVNEAVLQGENVRKLIVGATIGMALTGFLPYLIVAIWGPKLFAFVFGSDWAIAGEYAQWLSAWLFLQYVNKPAVAAIAPLRIQGGLFVYELFSTGSKVLALWIGFTFFEDDVIAVALFSMVGALAYLWLIFWVIYRSDVLPEP
ncbi:MAG: oligosaccharide flippase family protein [Halioglobus sp.]